MGLALRGICALVVALGLLTACWPQCCWVGGLAARGAATALGALLLEVFASLDERAAPRPRRTGSACEDVSLRVSKGVGSRGYGAVRVSAVCRLPPDAPEAPCPTGPGSVRAAGSFAFDHCGRFQHRWTDFHLSTGLVELQPGAQSLSFNHTSGPLRLEVSLPPRKAGVHGIVIGDPCISSRYIPGLCNGRWDVMSRLPQILDQINSVDPLDFVVILGDAFYDVHGGLTAEFWRRLSWRSQQVFLMAVPGNHDFWMFAPQATLPQDQLGFGFAQWYAQDTVATSLSAPASRRAPGLRTPAGLPGAEHFFFYHILGDVGFLGYSGAHTWESQAHLFREACSYFASEQPSQVYLLGHWNQEELGCEAGMDVPQLFSTLQVGACRAMADRMRYFMGHEHCNMPTPDGRGFLVGGAGAAQGNCNEWGFAYVDTRAGAGTAAGPDRGAQAAGHVVAKFTVATDEADYYPDLAACIAGSGSLSACIRPHSDIWVNETASA